MAFLKKIDTENKFSDIKSRIISSIKESDPQKMQDVLSAATLLIELDRLKTIINDPINDPASDNYRYYEQMNEFASRLSNLDSVKNDYSESFKQSTHQALTSGTKFGGQLIVKFNYHPDDATNIRDIKLLTEIISSASNVIEDMSPNKTTKLFDGAAKIIQKEEGWVSFKENLAPLLGVITALTMIATAAVLIGLTAPVWLATMPIWIVAGAVFGKMMSDTVEMHEPEKMIKEKREIITMMNDFNTMGKSATKLIDSFSEIPQKQTSFFKPASHQKPEEPSAPPYSPRSTGGS